MEVFLLVFSVERKSTSDSLPLQTLRRAIMDSDGFNCRKLELELFAEATDGASKRLWLPPPLMMERPHSACALLARGQQFGKTHC